MTNPNARPYVDPVEAHNWQLYDVTGRSGPITAQRWDMLQRQGPAEQVVDGSSYVFAPRRPKGQRLGTAYNRASKIITPCLRIRDSESDDYSALRLRFSKQYAAFSRLAMHGPRIRLYTPEALGLPLLDVVELDAKTGPAVFARDFDIITIEELTQQ
ncbi:MAG TPA: hypothetical protein VLE73_05780 [Candidatus Saccharimonadales bacterium]|nr:hypothetical protein [Candidatus Saccharimonadales bacterium]